MRVCTDTLAVVLNSVLLWALGWLERDVSLKNVRDSEKPERLRGESLKDRRKRKNEKCRWEGICGCRLIMVNDGSLLCCSRMHVTILYFLVG